MDNTTGSQLLKFFFRTQHTVYKLNHESGRVALKPHFTGYLNRKVCLTALDVNCVHVVIKNSYYDLEQFHIQMSIYKFCTLGCSLRIIDCNKTKPLNKRLQIGLQ